MPSSGTSNPEAAGLLSYRLASGRHCVSYCCHAGREHTARGGQRVYTHVVLLDPADFSKVDDDPIRVHTALKQSVDQSGPILKSGLTLQRLTLNVAALSSPPSNLVTRPAPLWHLAEQILGGRPIVYVRAKLSLPTLQWAMMTVPRGIRRQLKVSTGIRFSPSRELNLVLVSGDASTIRQRLAGRGVTVVDGNETGAAVEAGSSPAAWFALLQRWWREQRFQDIVRLTSDRAAHTLPGDLNQIAAECEAEDAAKKAQAEAEAEVKAPLGAQEQ